MNTTLRFCLIVPALFLAKPAAGAEPRADDVLAGLRDFYKKMIGIRRAHPALSRGVYTPLSKDGDLLVFLRRDAASGDAVLVAVNRGEGTSVAEVEAPAEWRGRPPTELLSGEPLEGDPLRLTVALPPRTARLYGMQ